MFKQPSVTYSLLVAAPLTAFFSLLVLLVAPIDWLRSFQKDAGERLSIKVKTTWCFLLLKALRINLKLSGPGLSKILKHQGAIIISNHQSILDIPVLMSILQPETSFIAKKELSRIPIFGQAAKAIGILFVDRSKGTKNEALQSVEHALKKGHNIVVFPEGTRSVDGKLREFKRGAFILAISSEAPLVPICILDSRQLCAKGSLAIAKGTIHVVVEEAISTKGLTGEDRFELAQRVFKLLSKHIENFSESRKNT